MEKIKPNTIYSRTTEKESGFVYLPYVMSDPVPTIIGGYCSNPDELIEHAVMNGDDDFDELNELKESHERLHKPISISIKYAKFDTLIS